MADSLLSGLVRHFVVKAWNRKYIWSVPDKNLTTKNNLVFSNPDRQTDRQTDKGKHVTHLADVATMNLFILFILNVFWYFLCFLYAAVFSGGGGGG